jgi:hypothetical protein
VASGVLHRDEEVVQHPQSGGEDPHVVFEGKPRSGDLLRSANQEGVAGLGEEASIVHNALLYGRIDRLFEEDGSAARVLHQPGQEFWWRLECLPVDLERADEVQPFQRFVECEQIAPFDHRSEEGGRPRSRCAPKRMDWHHRESRSQPAPKLPLAGPGELLCCCCGR